MPRRGKGRSPRGCRARGHPRLPWKCAACQHKVTCYDNLSSRGHVGRLLGRFRVVVVSEKFVHRRDGVGVEIPRPGLRVLALIERTDGGLTQTNDGLAIRAAVGTDARRAD